jgi:glycosyltransferase involved in cell wall biosynthesis
VKNVMKKKAIIASNVAPTYIGGLGSYQRFLARSLARFYGMQGTFVVIHPRHPVVRDSEESLAWPVVTLRVERVWSRLQKVLRSMGSRPILHPLLERLVSLVVPAKSVTKIDGAADWIHFVGTGWDFFGFALRNAARAAGARFTVWPAVHPKSWGDDAIDLRLYAQADGVFCQSKYEMRHLAALGVPERNLIGCGLPPMCRMDGNRERFRDRHYLDEDTPSVLFLGRRDHGKGYPALLDAWHLVLQNSPRAVLLLSGPGGTEFENVKAALPPASLRDLGVPDESGKADALAGCDVFCLPSSHESFGIAYVEAWAYRKPVICGEAPACRELIEDRVTGLWGDQDPASLAKQILLLVQQPELRDRLGREGRARQNRDFSPENVVKIHLRALGDDPI